MVLHQKSKFLSLYSVIAYGEILCQQDDATLVEYEARVMGFYFDYLPVLRSQRRDIVERNLEIAAEFCIDISNRIISPPPLFTNT